MNSKYFEEFKEDHINGKSIKYMINKYKISYETYLHILKNNKLNILIFD
jgi:hypothetical protein